MDLLKATLAQSSSNLFSSPGVCLEDSVFPSPNHKFRSNNRSKINEDILNGCVEDFESEVKEPLTQRVQSDNSQKVPS